MPDHDRRIAELRVLPILCLSTGAYIGPGALIVACGLPHFIVNSFLAYIIPGLVVTIRPMAASVWPLPSIIGRLYANKQIAILVDVPFFQKAAISIATCGS